MRSRDNGYVLLTVGQLHDSGLLQQVAVQPGITVRFSAWTHAWLNHHETETESLYPHPDDSRWSEGVGYDRFFSSEGQEIEDSRAANITF